MTYSALLRTMEGHAKRGNAMSLTRHYTSYTSARSNLRGVLDAARAGMVTTVSRDNERYVVVDAEVLRQQLFGLLPAKAVVIAEGGGWSAFLPSVPVHGEAETFEEAITDLIEALREYAHDWNDDLRTAPNHHRHGPLVELVELSTDSQLRNWLLDTTPDTARADTDNDRLADA